MTDEDLATLLRQKTQHYKYMDQGGWEDEEEFAQTSPATNMWGQYVHRSYLNAAKSMKSKLEDVPLETIIKVIEAL